MKTEPLVSVIIPTYNSARTIENCLKSVKAQTYKNIEIIVVDKFSTDGTKEIAEKFGARLFQANAERAKSKNIGIEKAAGEYVLFIDSDMELTKNIAKDCVNLIEKREKTGGIIIPERSVGFSFWIKVRDFERSFYADTPIESARFFRKDLSKKAGGFDEDIVFFEESTLPQKIKNLGRDVNSRIESEILHNEKNFSFWKWVNKKYYYGKTARKYKEKYKESALKQMGIYRFSLFLKNKRFYSKPVLALGILTLKFSEYFFAGMGYIVSKEENEFETSTDVTSIEKLPFVSFIIPTYNADEYLGKCLSSIEMLDYPRNKIEVFVIDGGSEDDTIKIAKKYGITILNNPKKDAESGKYIGIKKSKGEIIALVDSDNEIASQDWLSKMVIPMVSDESIIGVESQYLINDDFSMLNRYCTRLIIVDPLARLLASKPSVEKMRGYNILDYEKNSTPMIGANGFLWRKNVILRLNTNNSKFEETTFAFTAIKSGYTKFASVPGTGVYHYYSNSMADFIKKRIKIGNKFMIRKQSPNYWMNNVNKVKFALAAVYCATIIGPTLEALYQLIKTRDISWFLHPVMSLITALIYGRIYLENLKL